MYEIYNAGHTLVYIGSDRNGSFLFCFPCGYVFSSAANMLFHLVTSGDHFLGETLPMDLEQEIMRCEGLLSDPGSSNAIA